MPDASLHGFVKHIYLYETGSPGTAAFINGCFIQARLGGNKLMLRSLLKRIVVVPAIGSGGIVRNLQRNRLA